MTGTFLIIFVTFALCALFERNLGARIDHANRVELCLAQGEIDADRIRARYCDCPVPKCS